MQCIGELAHEVCVLLAERLVDVAIVDEDAGVVAFGDLRGDRRRVRGAQVRRSQDVVDDLRHRRDDPRHDAIGRTGHGGRDPGDAAVIRRDEDDRVQCGEHGLGAGVDVGAGGDGARDLQQRGAPPQHDEVAGQRADLAARRVAVRDERDIAESLPGVVGVRVERQVTRVGLRLIELDRDRGGAALVFGGRHVVQAAHGLEPRRELGHTAAALRAQRIGVAGAAGNIGGAVAVAAEDRDRRQHEHEEQDRQTDDGAADVYGRAIAAFGLARGRSRGGLEDPVEGTPLLACHGRPRAGEAPRPVPPCRIWHASRCSTRTASGPVTRGSVAMQPAKGKSYMSTARAALVVGNESATFEPLQAVEAAV